MVEPRRIGLPTYETLLTEAIRSLTVDSGTVTGAAAIGGNSLTDTTKNWATNVHRNRLVSIVRGTGAGQVAVIDSNSDKTLIIKQAWAKPLGTTSVYVILGMDVAQVLRDVFGGGSDISAANPLEVHDPKVGSLVSYEGPTDADGAADGSTLVCSDLTTKADYDGNLAIITSGDYAGQARDIAGSTAGGTITPHQNFGGQITQGTSFVIAALRTVPAEVAALAADIGTLLTKTNLLDLTAFNQETVAATNVNGTTWKDLLDKSTITKPTKIYGFKVTVAGTWAGKARIRITDGAGNKIFPFQDYYEQDTDFTSGTQVVFNFEVVVPVADGYKFQFCSSNAADGAGDTLALNNLDVQEIG